MSSVHTIRGVCTLLECPKSSAHVDALRLCELIAVHAFSLPHAHPPTSAPPPFCTAKNATRVSIMAVTSSSCSTSA